MAIDFKKMKAKLHALDNKGGSKNAAFWKPQDGDQNIRIVPTADGDPFKQFHFHYNVGKNPGFICPKKQHGKDCPVCNFAWHTYSEAKASNDQETLKFAKTLFPKERYFSPVVVRGEEDQGVRLWGYGVMAYRELVQLVLNPDYGDITDTDTGTDLVINYGKPPGAQFPQTSITPRRRPSPMTSDSEVTARYLDQIPDFSSLFERKTPEQVQEMLDEFLLGEESAPTTASTPSGENAVDKAFAELLS